MCRAAIRVSRTAYHCQSTAARGLTRWGTRPRRSSLAPAQLKGASCTSSGTRVGGLRSLSSLPSSIPTTTRGQPKDAHGQHLQSSMYIRRLSVALASGLVGFGAWYGYKGSGTAHTASLHHGATPTDGAPVPTRNVLIMGADEIHTGTFVGHGPVAKTEGSDTNVLEMLTPEQATQQLREHEESVMVNRGRGVLRYDLVQLASNNPIEDDHAEKIIEVAIPPSDGPAPANNDWMFWGVFDGHAGWTTSAKLRQALISFVARELNDTYKAAGSLGTLPSGEAIDAAIKNGFLRLDDEIVHGSVEKVFQSNSKRAAAELLGPAVSGSCALLSFYDSSSKTLRVACTGDSRAVLGRRSDSGKWTATALSEDQTGSNPNEEARMRKQHPGESRVIHNGRVLGGLEPTRAFGDASYKWSRDISDKLRASFFGRSYSPHLKTPPYVTAEPVVTTTKVRPEKGDFLIMATDGLWEMLTNDEVVGLVGKWMETQAADKTTTQLSSIWSKLFGTGQGLPVEAGKDAQADDGQKTPIRMRQWGISPDEKERFVVKDDNVATHVIRNALGGNNEEHVCALLTLVAPFSRRYRDDLTVQVIFFGDGQNTGEVFQNRDATNPAKSELKAKL